jgi:hypothetical protein
MSMQLFKGILFGLAVFVVGSIICIVPKMGPWEPNKATGLSVITASTVYNAWWWAVIAAAIAVAAAWRYYHRT